MTIYKSGTTRNCKEPLEAGKSKEGWRFQRKHGPSDTLILDMQPPEW